MTLVVTNDSDEKSLRLKYLTISMGVFMVITFQVYCWLIDSFDSHKNDKEIEKSRCN